MGQWCDLTICEKLSYVPGLIESKEYTSHSEQIGTLPGNGRPGVKRCDPAVGDGGTFWGGVVTRQDALQGAIVARPIPG